MLIRNQKGLSSTEILIAVSFLGIMVFFSYQMLLRQQNMVIKANQNVEATTILYEMRKVLSGPGCKENLAGLNRIVNPGNINSLKKITQFPDGTSEIEEVFVAKNTGAKKFSETGLKIQSYQLDPKGVKQTIRPDKTYLIVNFERGFDGPIMRKQIRIYTQETNGVITNCSLVPFIRSADNWLQVGSELQLKAEKLGVGTDQLTQKLNVKGGIFSTPPAGGCNQNSYGALFYNQISGHWELCTSKGIVSLIDNRSLPL